MYCSLDHVYFLLCCTVPWNYPWIEDLTALCVFRADGNYSAQGKLGAAVLGNVASQVYQLLLYKGRQQHVTSVRISPTFQFVVRTYTECYNSNGLSETWHLYSSECSSLVPMTGVFDKCASSSALHKDQSERLSYCTYAWFIWETLAPWYTYQVFAWLFWLCSHDCFTAWNIRWCRLSTRKSDKSRECNKSAGDVQVAATVAEHNVCGWVAALVLLVAEGRLL